VDVSEHDFELVVGISHATIGAISGTWCCITTGGSLEHRKYGTAPRESFGNRNRP
jgi:hypothetical protein